MNLTRGDWGLRLAMGGCFILGGCGTGPAGGGGGGAGGSNPPVNAPGPNGASLDNVQLGKDPALDADIRSFTEADVRVLGCLDEPGEPTEQQSLDFLKQVFPSIRPPPESFETFVATVAAVEEQKADEICTLELGNDAEVDAAVSRATEERNRGRACNGDEPVGDADTLDRLKRDYIVNVTAAPPFVEFVRTTAEEASSLADQFCSG